MTPLQSDISDRCDLAARLVRADYTESGRDKAGDYSTTYAYNANSAPTAITRKGLTSAVSIFTGMPPTLSFGDVDKLTMEYDGGKLVSVADAATDPTYTGAPDFRDGADSEEELFYDSNGRLVRDLNRGVDNITYNRLGLPELITFADNSTIRQIYSADGRLMQRIKSKNKFPGTKAMRLAPGEIDPYERDTADFVGPFVYENSKLVRTLVPGGYLQDGAAYYYVADHQGNVRKVLNGRGQTVQETHYYPYGMPFGESNAEVLATTNGAALQPYKYGGKESVSMCDLSFYDFAARPYDPALIIFHTPDPMQEKYMGASSHLYCLANPINFTDPTGMVVEFEGTVEQKEELKRMYDKQCENPLFKNVFDALDGSETVFTIQFGEVKPPSGMENNADNTFNGCFNSSSNTLTFNPELGGYGICSYVVAEETYHAYQTIVPENGVNIEFEAKTFAVIHQLSVGAMGLTEGPMSGIFVDILAENFDEVNHNGGNTFNMTQSFSSNYVTRGKQFVSDYSGCNIPNYTTPINSLPQRLNRILQSK